MPHIFHEMVELRNPRTLGPCMRATFGVEYGVSGETASLMQVFM